MCHKPHKGVALVNVEFADVGARKIGRYFVSVSVALKSNEASAGQCHATIGEHAAVGGQIRLNGCLDRFSVKQDGGDSGLKFSGELVERVQFKFSFGIGQIHEWSG